MSWLQSQRNANVASSDSVPDEDEGYKLNGLVFIHSPSTQHAFSKRRLLPEWENQTAIEVHTEL